MRRFPSKAFTLPSNPIYSVTRPAVPVLSGPLRVCFAALPLLYSILFSGQQKKSPSLFRDWGNLDLPLLALTLLAIQFLSFPVRSTQLRDSPFGDCPLLNRTVVTPVGLDCYLIFSNWVIINPPN